MLGLLERRLLAEHQAEYRRFLDREGDIGLTHGDNALERALALCDGHGHRPLVELLKAARGDLLEDLLFAAEMPVGRGGGDAGDAAGIGEGKVFRAALLDEPSRRVDQRFAQFAVMIANFSPHLVDQEIARLDPTDLMLAENAARAAVAAARSRRDVASDHLERAKVLLPKAIVSQATYDTRRNEFDAAASALDSAESQLQQAINAVSYATLRTDKAGIVTSVTGEPGHVVAAGQAVITLAEAGETEIAVAVPEQDAGRLRIGQRARITLWAGPHVTVEGRIREIAGQADPAMQTYAVRIAVPQPPPTMRLGMTATVALSFDQNTAPMLVRLTALSESDGGVVAFVVDAVHKVVRKTAVSVAGVAEDGVEIAGGLQVGDLVVTGGVQFLRDGMRIRLPGERAEADTP